MKIASFYYVETTEWLVERRSFLAFGPGNEVNGFLLPNPVSLEARSILESVAKRPKVDKLMVNTFSELLYEVEPQDRILKIVAIQRQPQGISAFKPCSHQKFTKRMGP